MLQLILLCLLPPASEQTSEANSIDTELRADVIMKWNFSCKLDPNITFVLVTQSRPRSSRDVIRLRGGVPEVFDPYKGRVQLLTEGFPDGIVVLKMNSNRIPDAGKYQCLIETPTSTDLRFFNMTLRAPWRDIKQKNDSVSGEERVLFCESEGYPPAAVTWTDKHGHNLTKWANSTTSRTSEQLWHIVSQLNVNISSTYTCTFTDDRGVSKSASFDFTDRKLSRHLYVSLAVLILFFVLGVVVMMKKRNQKHKEDDITVTEGNPPWIDPAVLDQNS